MYKGINNRLTFFSVHNWSLRKILSILLLLLYILGLRKWWIFIYHFFISVKTLLSQLIALRKQTFQLIPLTSTLRNIYNIRRNILTLITIFTFNFRHCTRTYMPIYLTQFQLCLQKLPKTLNQRTHITQILYIALLRLKRIFYLIFSWHSRFLHKKLSTFAIAC